MIGFLVGVTCLWGLVRVLRGGPRARGPWGWHRRHGGPPWDREGSRYFLLRRLFEELDTTPGQEKEIRRAVDEVTEAAEGLKDRLYDTRNDLGKALRGEVFDEALMTELWTRHDEPIDELRKAVVGALGRIHGALDDDQRKRLASWLQRRRPWGGPYRSCA
jgi:hypothetical protein